MIHKSFSTVTRGLQREIPPMRMYEKAKRLGIWNPTDITWQADQRDWEEFTAMEKDLVLRLTAMFQAGEEAVTLDLLPLIQVIAQEGRIEEEMFLTTFLFEEAKHTDFFRRFLDEVTGMDGDLSRYHTDNYREIFYSQLPAALERLRSDPSPAAQLDAAVTYNLIVEGVLAETGYHAFYTMLEQNDKLPGLRQGIKLLKQDESRHIAYGVFLISRLISVHDELWERLQERMNSLLIPAIGVIDDAFACYDPDEIPFGLTIDDFTNYAMDQFSKRFERIERSRGASLEEIYRVTSVVIEENDG